MILIFITVESTVFSYESPLIFGTELERSVKEYQKVYDMGKAIAKCEGYGKAGAIPTRLNNPGNLKAGYPSDSQGHTKFKTSISGWNALHFLLMTRYANKTPLEMNRMGYASDQLWYKCVEFYLLKL